MQKSKSLLALACPVGSALTAQGVCAPRLSPAYRLTAVASGHAPSCSPLGQVALNWAPPWWALKAALGKRGIDADMLFK